MIDKKPEEMSPEELEQFVRKALLESKKQSAPRELQLWWDSVRKIRDKDLRRILR